MVYRGPAAHLRHLAFGRVIPGVLYGFLTFLVAGNVSRSITESAGHDIVYVIAHPVRQALYLLFCSIPIAIYVTRPAPKARDGSLPARAAAFAGTLMLLGVAVIGNLASTSSRLPGWIAAAPLVVPGWVGDAAALALLVFTALEVYALLHLRLSFSIIPEARRLVTNGPYAIVRNPLYAAEIGAATAWVVSEPRPLLLIALVPFIALQLLRLHYEEELLRRTFPEYADYATRTARLIPFIW